jgi:hypothetical protein
MQPTSYSKRNLVGTGKCSLAEEGLQILNSSKDPDLIKLMDNKPLSMLLSFNGSTIFNNTDEKMALRGLFQFE